MSRGARSPPGRCAPRSSTAHRPMGFASGCSRGGSRPATQIPTTGRVSELAASSAFGVGEMSFVEIALCFVVVPVVPLGMYKGARQCHAEVTAHA
jgi:hypothetical protein